MKCSKARAFCGKKSAMAMPGILSGFPIESGALKGERLQIKSEFPKILGGVFFFEKDD